MFELELRLQHALLLLSQSLLFDEINPLSVFRKLILVIHQGLTFNCNFPQIKSYLFSESIHFQLQKFIFQESPLLILCLHFRFDFQ